MENLEKIKMNFILSVFLSVTDGEFNWIFEKYGNEEGIYEVLALYEIVKYSCDIIALHKARYRVLYIKILVT